MLHSNFVLFQLISGAPGESATDKISEYAIMALVAIQNALIVGIEIEVYEKLYDCC